MTAGRAPDEREPNAWRIVRAAFRSRPAALAASLGLAILALWLTARGLDLTQVGSAIRRLPVAPFAASFLCMALVLVLRAGRLHLLLTPVRSSPMAALETILAGYLFTTLLPLRAGEAVRIGYCARRTGAPLLSVTGAVALERLFDVATLALLASVSLSAVAAQRVGGLTVPPWVWGGAAAAATVGVLALGRLLRRRFDRRGRSSAANASRLDRALHGLAALASLRLALGALLTSLALWTAAALSVRCALAAAGLEVSLAEATVVLLGTCFAIALPATPASVGAYHLGFVAGALLIGIPREISLPVATVQHLVVQTPFLPFGALALLAARRRGREGPADERPGDDPSKA